MAQSIGTRDEGSEQEKLKVQPEGMPFFPDFALREAITALVVLVALVLLATLIQAGLEEQADPSATDFVPRPEWYFLWLFQALKYFKGDMEILGVVVIPALALGLLVALPFIDRSSPAGRPLLPGTRPVRVWPRAVGAGIILLLGSLTLMGLESEAPMPEVERELTPAQAAGLILYEKMGCASCHAVGGEGGISGPDLTRFGSRPDANQRVLLHFAGVGRTPESIMPGYQLSPEELEALASYLLSLRGR